MKKLLLLILIIVTARVTVVFAQNRTITGTVIAKEDNLPLPGAIVKIAGTNTATSTDANGKYTINIPKDGVTLHFSFLGSKAVDIVVESSNIINVSLAPDSRQLSEVVVTGFGVRQEKRALGYAQSTVKSETVNKSSPIDLFGGIQGKVAGATISEVSGTPGGSTKIILRGFSSIGQSNQPLYVIDGVPLDNSRPTFANAYDFGNNANDVDPNSVESISLLKGSAATAIYGSRGSSGVILITTKKGKSGKPVVDFSSGTTLTNAANTYQLQKEFGQGWNGTYISSENGDWGPRFDGKIRPWGAVVNNTQLLKPFSFIEGNVANTFDTGLELNNDIAISGGNDISTYRMAYGNVHSDGILPGPFDLFKSNKFSLRGATSYKKFSADASLNYTNRNGSVPQTGDGSVNGAGFYGGLLQIPNDIPIRDLRDYKNQFFNIDNYYTPYAENPFYSLNENGSHYVTNHTFGNINLNYKFSSWFTLNLQQSADISSTYDKIFNNANKPSPGSWNDGANVEGQQKTEVIGSVSEQTFDSFEYDTKLQAVINKKLTPDINLNGFIGANYNDRGNNSVNTGIVGLAIPGFYNLSNSLNKPTSTQAYSHRRLFAGYAQATLDYKQYLYLAVTGRNDVTSTLAPGKNSYFYPGANLSFILTDALNWKSQVVSYVKLRASYGRTGSDTGPYSIYNTLTSANIPLTFGNITFPVNGVAGYTISNSLLSTDLKPEQIAEFEFGGEFRFLNDRIGLDVTYYNRTRKDQILAVPIAPSSGYTSEVVNFGTVRNRGLELTLNATAVKSNLVQWDITYIFSLDRNKVLSLPSGLNKVVVTGVYDAQMVAIIGQPIGVLQAPVPVYDPQGHIVVDNTGLPLSSPNLGNYGTIQPQFHMGLTNSFKIQNFALGFTLDYQQGGKFYSGTADLLNFIGADPKTTYNDRNPFIVPNSVQVSTDANGNTVYTENKTPLTENNYYSYYYPSTNKATTYNQRILTKTFVKLREVSLGYNLPKAFVSGIGAQRATVSVFGRNLYTWLPASNKTIDPEVSNFGSDLASEFGEFRTAPPLRYLGASLKLTF